MRILLALLVCLAALGAIAQDDHLVLDPVGAPSIDYGDQDLATKIEQLKNLDAQLAEAFREVEEMERQADEKQRDLDRNKKSLEQSDYDTNMWQISDRKLDTLLNELEESLPALERSRDGARANLVESLRALYLAKQVYGDAAGDSGDQTWSVHSCAWRSAAQHAAFRFGTADTAIKSAQVDIVKYRGFLGRGQGQVAETQREAERLKHDIAKDAQALDKIDSRRRQTTQEIAKWSASRSGLGHFVHQLLEQRRAAPSAPGAEGATASDDDGHLILGSAPPTTIEPASGGTFGIVDDSKTPGFVVETGPVQAVHAVISGEVLYAGELKGYEHVVIVGHDEKRVSVYAYLSRTLVDSKERIYPGDPIGLSGAIRPGSDQCGARFETRVDGAAVDPFSWPETPRDLQRALIQGVSAR